jgi:hypothetical protein
MTEKKENEEILITGVPGIVTLMNKKIEPLIFLLFFFFVQSN